MTPSLSPWALRQRGGMCGFGCRFATNTLGSGPRLPEIGVLSVVQAITRPDVLECFGGGVGDGTEPIRLTDEQRLDWLRLIRSQNVGPRTFRALINHFGGARAALDALPGLARRGGGGTRRKSTRASRPSAKSRPRERSASIFVAHRRSGLSAAAADDRRPAAADRDTRPRDVLVMPPVAIVGSRNASAARRQTHPADRAGAREAGFAIVSGLARGIDAAAHRASLATGTIAVLAGGHDRIYPPEHADLLDAILPKARRSPKCRLAGSRGRAIFRAATV